MIRGIVIRLFPSQDQEVKFKQHIGSCRFIYNYLLQYQTENYKNGGKCLARFDMNKLITNLKKLDQYKFLNEVSTHSLQLMCVDLDQAFKKFFNKTGNYPKFKSKNDNKHQSFPVRNEHSVFYFKDGFVQIPLVGKVKYQMNYDEFDESDFDKI